MAQEANHIDAAIADLEAWRDQINVAIQTLQHFRDKGLSLPSSAPPGNVRNGQIASDAFFQMTVPDAAEKYLKLIKATKEISELADALIKGGLKSSSKKFPDMVRSVLSRDSRFVKVPDAGWGLSEWYPGMRKEKKSKPQPQQPTEQKREPAGSSGPHRADDMESAGDKILAAMRANQNEEWTATKLTEKTGLKHRTVQGTIFRLRHEGKITNRVGGKGYMLAEQYAA